ncbi:NAD(P)H-binding protein [Foetidibacter luteolus]|uniref:NAD(P)H-binding protein n=1 Tax=Foetidibacter luteolus TaxID=2608880 RepID=UPI00129A763A|nr:NAD(P)H-binding protein [Foetidibacter luteolus]
MKYVITGGLGHISKPVTEALVKNGKQVTVVSSSESRKPEIEKAGAAAAIGSVADRDFVTTVFQDADIVYLMIPPNFQADDFPAYQKIVADNYVAAIKNSKITHVVLLSSIGAHLRKGAGPIDALGYLEGELEKLDNLNLKLLRPSYFYYNLFTMAGLIKHAGIAGSNFGSTDEKLVLVHDQDIAEKVTSILLNPDFTGHTIEYISSDERHPQEIAAVLGKAIGKDNLAWVTFTDEQAEHGMLQAGLKPTMAENYTAMGRALREGRAQEDYWRNKPLQQGKTKLEEFAASFAGYYKSLAD